jgi:hypothetical protein
MSMWQVSVFISMVETEIAIQLKGKKHMTVAGFGLAFLYLFGLIFLIGIFGSIFWIWMLIDCLTKEPDEGNIKLAWALTIVFLHFIGSSLYYFIRRPDA